MKSYQERHALWQCEQPALAKLCMNQVISLLLQFLMYLPPGLHVVHGVLSASKRKNLYIDPYTSQEIDLTHNIRSSVGMLWRRPFAGNHENTDRDIHSMNAHPTKHLI